MSIGFFSWLLGRPSREDDVPEQAGTPARPVSAMTPDEIVARDMLAQHAFSKRLLEEDGELEEINKEQARKEISPERRAQGMAKGIADLIALGHSEGRAKHIIEAREEKKRLQNELISAGWSRSEVWAMKPKAMKEALNGASIP